MVNSGLYSEITMRYMDDSIKKIGLSAYSALRSNHILLNIRNLCRTLGCRYPYQIHNQLSCR